MSDDDEAREAHAWLCHPMPDPTCKVSVGRDGESVEVEYRVACRECDHEAAITVILKADSLLRPNIMWSVRDGVMQELGRSFTPTDLDRLRRFGDKRQGLAPSCFRGTNRRGDGG